VVAALLVQDCRGGVSAVEAGGPFVRPECGLGEACPPYQELANDGWPSAPRARVANDVQPPMPEPKATEQERHVSR
jgi:hypothetical protein